MPTQEVNIVTVVFIAASILSCILVYFLVNFIRQQRKLLAWQKARTKAEIDILEQERKRIATDLHDEIGPLLSAVKLQINHLEIKEEEEQIILFKSTQQIDDVIQKFRTISYNLLPNTLIRKGLVAAVEEFIYKIQPLTVDIKFKAEAFTLEPAQEINLFRVIQEIVHNTIKHARAITLTIFIHNKEGNIVLHTKDDGIGFEYEETNTQNLGLGLLSLQNRVEVLNGNLQIKTGKGEGTQIIISIPQTNL